MSEIKRYRNQLSHLAALHRQVTDDNITLTEDVGEGWVDITSQSYQVGWTNGNGSLSA